MILAKVTSEVVSTVKNDRLAGNRILSVHPINLKGEVSGPALLALDRVDAGLGDTVLVNREGGGARLILGDPQTPAQAVIVAVVEGIHVDAS